MPICTKHISLNFLPFWFSACRKQHHLALFVYLFGGSNKRHKICFCGAQLEKWWRDTYSTTLNIYVCLYFM